jgi:hypothetical protein
MWGRFGGVFVCGWVLVCGGVWGAPPPPPPPPHIPSTPRGFPKNPYTLPLEHIQKLGYTGLGDYMLMICLSESGY